MYTFVYFIPKIKTKKIVQSATKMTNILKKADKDKRVLQV